jgi:predicted signal transduction protein with EAL and GGDEF domain
MSEESNTRRSRPLLLVAAGSLFVLSGWHFFCHLQLEAGLEKHANDYLRNLNGATATVQIQPLTNLVSIHVDRPVRANNNEFAETIGDALVEFVRRDLEPQVERQLATAARSDIDLYAMLVPYHVSIDVEKVRAGFSRLVQDTQQELIRLGYSIGNADGINGRKTREAIAHVQAQLGREQDGQASEELLSLLRKATPAR